VVKQGLLPVLERPAVQKTVLAPTDAVSCATCSYQRCFLFSIACGYAGAISSGGKKQLSLQTLQTSMRQTP